MKVFVLTLIAALAGGMGRANAAGSAEVEALIREGVALRQSGRDERALPLFQKAYELDHSPRTEGQLGLAELAVGYYLDAEKHLSEALGFPDHPWIAKNARSLQDALDAARDNIGEIVVEGGPAGATVVINGHVAGTLPLPGPVRVGKGPADIEVRASGYTTAARSLRLAGKERQSATVVLERAADAAAPGSPAGGTAGGGAPAGAPPPSVPDDHATAGGPVREGAAPSRAPVWLAAGAIAAVATGIVGTVVWQSRRGDFANHLGPPLDDPNSDPLTWKRDCGESLPSRGSAACQGLYDSSKQARTVAVIGYAVGGVLAVSALVSYRMTRSERASSSSLACAPALPALVMTCGLTF